MTDDLRQRIVKAIRDATRYIGEDTIDNRIGSILTRIADDLDGPSEAELQAERQAAEAEAERRLADMDRLEELQRQRQERIRKELEEANRIPVDSLELLNRVRKAKGEPIE